MPHDDPATYELIRTTRTLGMFQIESPGQRELVGKLGPSRFDDLIVDISLFRPGPVKSDMITPFLNSRHGWSERRFLHPSLIPALEETEGVVVFHEQVLLIVAETTGVTLAQADEVRRSMGTPQGQTDVEAWWRPAARARGYSADDRDRIWEVLKSFASFGFCKAHAAAFALPTFHSAWLKTHHPAAFLAGILTHDPGMYPKRLLLDDARSFGIPVLGLDVNASRDTYRIERVDAPDAERTDPDARDRTPDPAADAPDPDAGLPAWRRTHQPYGIRLSLADVKGISEAEVARIVAGQPYADLGDFWTRARVSRPVTERLVLAGAFDSPARHGRRAGWAGAAGSPGATCCCTSPSSSGGSAGAGRRRAAAGGSSSRASRRRARWRGSGSTSASGRPRSRRRPVRSCRRAEQPTQLTLDLGDRPQLGARRRAARDDRPGAGACRARRARPRRVARTSSSSTPRCCEALGVTRSRDLLAARSRSEVRVAGVKVATQTPPMRSGRRVVFLTLDDSTGPADCTFFEDVQGPYAATVFHSWLLLVRGVLRRTGDRGVSIRATGAWELAALWDAWQLGGLAARARAAIAGGGGGCRGPRRGGRGGRPARATPAPGAGCSCTPRGSGSRPTPTSSRPGRPARGLAAPRAVVVPAGTGRRAALAQAVARQPRQLRTLGWSTHTTHPPRPRAPAPEGGPPCPTSVADTAARAPSPGCARPPSRRRSTPSRPRRSADLGRPLRVLDLGGGTGGIAVPLAAAGHDVTVVDPSPDALASLARRAAETGTSERIHRRAGRHRHRRRARRRRRAPAYDLVCLPRHPRGRRRPGCRAAPTSRPSSPPAARSRSSSRSGSPAVLARALAGQFAQARAILERPDGRWGDDDPRRAGSTRPAVRDLLAAHGLTTVREPRRAHLQRPGALGPGRLRGRPGSPCSSSRTSRATDRDHPLLGEPGQRAARPRDPGLTPAGGHR